VNLTASEHRLVLLRHAKSSYPHGVPDHERPLAGKGRRNAQAAGEWFVAEGPRPDLVLCSDATRARHTWEIIAAGLDPAPPVRSAPELYYAGVAELVDLARRQRDTVHTLVLVGHEPTLSETVLTLAGPGSDPTALSQIERKFPTGGIAVLRLAAGWRSLGVGSAVLERFAVPRAGAARG
jgi:phosphohistidine phosphatase